MKNIFLEYFDKKRIQLLENLISICIAEDGIDISSNSVFSNDDMANAILVCKEDMVIAGTPLIEIVLKLTANNAPDYSFDVFLTDGTKAKQGDVIAKISASTRHLLRSERIILNLISHCCGVASLTNKYAKELEGSGVKLLDTRKTMPGLRYLDKYSVRMGGGFNHRFNLEDMVMLKDNHIDASGGIIEAVKAVRTANENCPPIEVECRKIEEVLLAIEAKADRIMLDNMDNKTLNEALLLIPQEIEAEISGNVSLENIKELAYVSKRQPQFISVGKITHSARVADISMKIES